MEQKLAQLQAKIEADKGLGEKLFSLENPEDVQNLLKEQGIDFSLEEIDMLKQALVKVLEKDESGELSDDDLEDVAGAFLFPMVVALYGVVSAFITGATQAEVTRSRW